MLPWYDIIPSLTTNVTISLHESIELAFHPTVVAKHLYILLFSICHGVTMKYKSKITRFRDKFAVQSKVIVRLVITIGGRSIIH